ncbi:DUF4386 domain-containing protein [Dictyobacter alpinus]|uniref:DUF4386 domain-containing protein n=1 Tax=Dictyobacter alpinus TaxID=2014873 RepID=UPI000F82D518|nr:DUF4386 domain-containing protein [Dictyobacter alpinus]
MGKRNIPIGHVSEVEKISPSLIVLLSIVTLRQTGSGVEALVTSHVLVTLYDRIFLLGQSFMPAICDLLLGFLLYQSRLVPRVLSLIGIIGAPILLVSYIATMFGLIGQHTPLVDVSAILKEKLMTAHFSAKGKEEK